MKLKMQNAVEKTEYIIDHCRGKCVLHVGCTCYPNTIDRINKKSFLHDNLLEAADCLHGIDIDKDGLGYMKDKGYTDIYNIDILKLKDKHKNLHETYEIILLSDVIEHIEDPGQALRSVYTRLDENGEIILSVPNAFYWYAFINILYRREITHPDHVAWYSQTNLFQLINRTGFQITDIRYFYESPLTKKYDSISIRLVKYIERKLLLNIFPGLACGIICRAKKRY